jgi:hypothetical protein
MMKPKVVKPTYFHDGWLKVENYKEWLKKLPDNTQFGCKWCNPSRNTFRLGNMGERAVLSHMGSNKHIDAKKHQDELKNFFQRHVPKSSPNFASTSSSNESQGATSAESQDTTSSSSAESQEDTSSAEITNASAAESTDTIIIADTIASSSSSDAPAVDPCNVSGKLQSTLTHGLRCSQVIKAEIIWCLRTVMKDHSNSSNEDISLTFRSMFPDDQVVSNFTCGKDKTKYLVNYGIGPWVKELLNIQLDNSVYVVVGFDESLNKVTQTCQMDLNVRYWDPVDHRVKVRYYDSTFLGHSKNTDLLRHYNDAIMRIDSSKIVQVSMDGPAVNHLFYKKLVQHREDVKIMQLMVDIGSCGIHIIHGAFKFSFEKTSWNIKGIIKGSFVLLHDTPARRADYITITSSELFPLFFCATRWVEDKAPADRLREIWPNIIKIVKFWLTLTKKKQPSGKSFDAVKGAVEDPLTIAKLSFFSYIASILQPFLEKYQTPKPMIPYLYADLSKVYKSLLDVIVKEDVLEDCNGCQLPKVDIDKNVKKEKDFTIGFVTQAIIKELKKKDDVKNQQLKDFYDNIQVCIKALIAKLNERCALSHVVVRNANAFNPVLIMQSKIKSLKRKLMLLLEHSVSLKIIKASDCDKIVSQYASLKVDIDTAAIKIEEFPETRLDDFFYSKMKIHSKYPELSVLVSLILTLSHGNADIERGFSLNKGVLKDNMKEDSVVNKRLVKDHMLSHEQKPHTITITNELNKSCRHARSRYHQHLEDKKKENEKTTSETAKEIIKMEIEEIQSKISLLEKSKDTLNNKFDKIVMNTANMPNDDVVIAISEANALKRKAIEQTEDIRKLEESVKTMQEKRGKM